MFKSFLIICLFSLFLGCASHPKIIKTACPPRPTIEQIEVIGGELNRENTERVIENWKRLWEYIHRIEKLGCTR